MSEPITAPVKRIAQIINHQIHPSEPAVASAAINNAKRVHAEMVAPAVARAEAAEARIAALEAERDELVAANRALREPPKVYVVDESTT